jgi:hypothetical protein
MSVKLTKEKIEDLSSKVEGLVMLEMGRQLPFVCALVTGDGQLGLFTNRRSNEEVIMILEECLTNVRSNSDKFRPL